MYELVVLTGSESENPKLHWDGLKMHCVKTYEQGAWDGEINLYISDEITATNLNSEINQLCGYIRSFKKDEVEFYLGWGSGPNVYSNERRVVKPFVYTHGVRDWVLEVVRED